jgi:hypothetical protein
MVIYSAASQDTKNRGSAWYEIKINFK